MFYEPSKGHGLPHDPFKALVAPRPIGWISTQAKDGSLNLAPYSFFNALGTNPHLVMFCSEGAKDSYTNALETGEFVANLVSSDLIEQMNASSVDAPHGVSEFDYAGLTPEPSRLVRPPRVREAHAALECKVTEILSPKDLNGDPTSRYMIIGQVVGVYISDDALTDGMFDVVKAGNVARLGYLDFSNVKQVFQRTRPRWKD
ncbi:MULTISPECIES: flavin reductase family protein [unclassified Aminobacter]|uniref:flavin reductase family protein n=1 Tax=unclassified Aminobacter TaxID=2644704 RepID=UPI000466D9A9|nr:MULTISPECIES: flavin reductase family protein [unclassified Aminobacter]TWG61667.1 flavin reductase (DIM6/NTAB) family NADH-FMN oxidoreductase RutF [Aminobacter sp. J44]TWH31934.1 flavin reductase (DIM6/NTAB) family NADH-FMN oxidoreductase RutF [Aminobacter sp. J15]